MRGRRMADVIAVSWLDANQDELLVRADLCWLSALFTRRYDTESNGPNTNIVSPGAVVHTPCMLGGNLTP